MAILFAIEVIPFLILVVLIWIFFGLAILGLIFIGGAAILGSISAPNSVTSCFHHFPCLLAGMIGTILSAILALVLIETSLFIPLVIAVGIMAFFFTLMIVGVISFINCVVSGRCCRRRD